MKEGKLEAATVLQLQLKFHNLSNQMMSEYQQYAADLIAKTLAEQIQETQKKLAKQQKEWDKIQEEMEDMEKLQTQKMMQQPPQ
jgi:hypothetical protein